MPIRANEISRRRLLRRAAVTLPTVAGLRAVAAVASEGVSPARTGRTPVAFVGHGSPMLALDPTKGRELTAWMREMGRPKAIVVLSAHYTKAPVTIGATTSRPLIYDFRGFPRELSRVRYRAPGAPKAARRVKGLLTTLGPVREDPRRGLDHGAWVPLRWMVPKADVPVLPVSLPSHDPKTLYRMGRALRPLREEGVLLLASGNVTHNLRRLSRDPRTKPPAWARDFDAWTRDVLVRSDVDGLLDWARKAPAPRTNHPTVEHFVPLILAAGARHDDDTATFPIEGFENGSISRRCVTLRRPPRAS